jgi:hypothetical protein
MEVGFIILGLLWAMNRNRQAEAQAQLEATRAAMTNNMHSHGDFWHDHQDLGDHVHPTNNLNVIIPVRATIDQRNT